MQAYLKKHGTGAAYHTVKASWLIEKFEITLEFTVNKRSSKGFIKDETFSTDWSKNWGLWNSDVVEAFIQLRAFPDDLKAPYLEVQVSPLNQPFALIIVEPRKTFHPPRTLDFTHEVLLEGNSWKSKLRFSIPDDLKGNLYYGGFFACLEKSPREYYAVNPNPETAPDFHRPEFFIPLGEHE